MPDPAEVIPAAGGVLWRPDGHRPLLALVHRPRYNDWSLPKGKLLPGEHPVLGGVREVEEETGRRVVVGPHLDRQHYVRLLRSGPTPKFVDFWAMREDGGAFAPTDEVDAVDWHPLEEAVARVTLERDRETLSHFAAAPYDTTPILLVRHAHAGKRAEYEGDDRQRPLTALGQAQANHLRDVLECYRVRHVLSADVVRCVDTVRPYAARHGIEVEPAPAFAEDAYRIEPQDARRQLVDLIAARTPTAVCSQGGTIPGLLTSVCSTYRLPTPADPRVAKGGTWVLHVDDTGTLVAADRLPPPDAEPAVQP